MRLYANLEDVGSEYSTVAPTQLSLEPFNGCYYIDLPESGIINIITFEGEYKNGVPIGEPYFEEY